MEFTLVKLNEFRKAMPVTKSFIYLNHAAFGPNPEITTKLMEKIVSSKRNGKNSMDWVSLRSQFKETRMQIGKLVNSSENEIAMTISTAHGISHILSSIDWASSSEKGMIINDMEFTSNSFPYQQVSKKFNTPLHLIPSKTSNNIDNNIETVSVDDYKKVLETTNANLIGISAVQFFNGFKIDLDKLCKVAHEYQAMVLVDGIQAVGSMDIDVRKADIDFLACGGHKWLLGPMTTGFIYIKEKLLNTLDPMFVGPTSSEPFPLNFRHHEFKPIPSALKFHHSMLPYSPGLGESIKLLNTIGIKTIETQITELVDYLREKFLNAIPKSKCISPEKPNNSGIITFVLPETFNLENFEEKIANESKISISVRSGGIRFSPHAYNTKKEIDKAVKAIKKAIF